MKRAAPGAASGAWTMGVGLAAVAAILWVRFYALSRGLPHEASPDEARAVEAALSWSSAGPAALWPGLLAGVYGLGFGVWSVFGLRRGPADFAALSAFSPAAFLLAARVLAAMLAAAALVVVAKTETRGTDRAGRRPLGAWLLAFAPLAVEQARAGAPDALALLACAGALFAALRHQEGGSGGWLLACGAAAGAACAARLSAFPVLALAPAAWLMRADERERASWSLGAAALAVAAYFCSSPASLLAFPELSAQALETLAGTDWSAEALTAAARAAALAAWSWGGPGSLAGLCSLAGAVLLLRRDARRGVLLAGCAIIGLGGGRAAALPALAVLAGEALSALAGASAPRRLLLALLAVAPGFAVSAAATWRDALPDTRVLAARWLKETVPSGRTVLLDLPAVSPFAIPSREQAEEQALRAEAAGSSRARHLRALAERHPGGGWRLHRLQRAGRASGDFLDVRPGLDPVRALRVDWVVTSNEGVDPARARELATFFSELAEQGELVREFRPEEGKAVGPWLRVWNLRR